MTKKKIILLGVVSFLLIVFFLPRQIDTYHQDGDSSFNIWTIPRLSDIANQMVTDPDGYSNYYTVSRIYFSLFSYRSEEHQLGKQSGSFILPALIIGEKQSLREPHELTHEERFDILNSVCQPVVEQRLSPCWQSRQSQGCPHYIQIARYDYCISIYYETSFSDEECKLLQDGYLEFWEKYDYHRKYRNYDKFAEDFCKKDPLG